VQKSALSIAFLAVAAVAISAAAPVAGQTAETGSVEPFAAELRAIVPTGSAEVVEAAGISRSGRRLISLETTEPLDGARRRLVIVGGLDGDRSSALIVLAFLKWWLQDQQAAELKKQWQIVAVPCARPDGCGSPAPTIVARAADFPPPIEGFYAAAEGAETRYLWRWTALQGPDLVLEVRTGSQVRWELNRLAHGRLPGEQRADTSSLAGALGEHPPSGLAPVPAAGVSTPPEQATDVLRQFLERADQALREPSALRQALAARVSRPPAAVARLLAGAYPTNPDLGYVPAVTWSAMLRLGALTGESQWRDKVRRQTRPLIAGGGKPAAPGPVNTGTTAGHAALHDLAVLEGNRELEALARRAADSMLPPPPETIARFRTEDMFMTPFLLSRVGARSGDERYASALGRHLVASADKLQREDGLFVHATGSPFAWGRGNGFAALGLSEALLRLPASASARARLLSVYTRQMQALVRWQAPDGMWREIVDEPGSYRELTATSMIMTALARGLRGGWIGVEFRAVVDRAWRGLLARIADDAALLDVCISTGGGPDKQYYLDRTAIAGTDDRGGAMALVAAVEMAELLGAPR
jgi:rhamnogalacturonyl hydrolase YesR